MDYWKGLRSELIRILNDYFKSIIESILCHNRHKNVKHLALNHKFWVVLILGIT